MSAKQIIYGDLAREKLKKGVDALSKAVSTTLGPKGGNVALDKGWGTPQVVHDGVTVAKEIELEDKFENMGAQIVKEAASKTNDVAGDGTTTSTVLAQAIVEAGIKNISAGANAMMLRKGLEKATNEVVKAIGSMSKKISSKEEKAQVAIISAQNETIGNLIAEAMEKVGDDGVISFEESNGFEIELDYKEGMQFDKGYSSPYFITDENKSEAVIEEPYVLVTNSKITNMQELVPLLNKLMEVSKDLVIIADEIDGDAQSTLIVNKLRGALNVLTVKSPGFGDRRQALLEDIATLVGARFINKEIEPSLKDLTLDDLGRCSRVISKLDSTTIIGGKGTSVDIKKRIKGIKEQMKEAESAYDKETLKNRLSKLSGGVAIIKVGANSESEMVELKLRVEDAVNATKAAVEEGIVAGGGITLLKARKAIENLVLIGDEATGAKILNEALESPLRTLIRNAGLDSGKIMAKLDDLEENMGFDVISMDYVDMFKAGIIDPAKVTRSALENAVSVATMILTTECLVTNIEDERKDTKII